MTEHTEGPWQSVSIDHDPYTIIGGIDGPDDDGRMHFTEVCTVNETAAGAAGNARLIIAAPDLLKANNRLMAALHQAALELGEAANVMRPSLPSLAEVYDKAAATALASAEGKS